MAPLVMLLLVLLPFCCGSKSSQTANWTNCSANSEIEMTFVTTAMTWNAAEQSCQRAQGHLASVITPDEMQCAMRAFMQGSSIGDTANVSCNESHVGLRSFGDSTRMYRLGEVNSQLTTSRAMPASEVCVFWTKNGPSSFTLGRGSCNVTERFFLCQRLKLFSVPPMPCVVTTTKMTSSPGVATTTMPGVSVTTKMTTSPGEATTTMPGFGVTTKMKSSPDVVTTTMPGVSVTTKIISSHGVATTTMPGVGATTKMTSSPDVATTTMPGVSVTTNMTSSPGVTMTTPAAEASNSKSSNIGLYAGAGAGAVVLLLLIGIVALLLKRTQERRGKPSAGELLNVHRGSESGGVGLLRQPEGSRLMMSNPNYEQAPIPKATSLGSFANPTYTDVVNPTPKVPPPFNAVLRKEPTAGSGGSSQDAGASNNTPPTEGFYNTLQYGKDKEAGSGGLSQAAGATNTTPPPEGPYNTLQQCKDIEAGSGGSSQAAGAINTAPATSPGAFANPTFTDDVKPTPKLPPPIYAVVRKEPTSGSGGLSQDAGTINTTPPPEGFYNTLQHGKDKEAGSGGSSQAAGAMNTTPQPGGFYSTREHDKDKEASRPSGSEVCIHASVGRQG